MCIKHPEESSCRVPQILKEVKKKSTKIINAGKDVMKGNAPILLVWMESSTANTENSMDGPQKLNIKHPYDPETPLLAELYT